MGFKYHAKITEQQLPQMDTGTVPAILRDLSVSNGADKPITAGLFKLQAGKSLKYTYTYTYTYILRVIEDPKKLLMFARE